MPYTTGSGAHPVLMRWYITSLSNVGSKHFFVPVQGFAFQCLSSRLGIATGLNLAQHCGKEYPRLPRYLMWVCMEIAIIGADIQEVIGSAIAIALLSNNVIPLWAGKQAQP